MLANDGTDPIPIIVIGQITAKKKKKRCISEIAKNRIGFGKYIHFWNI